MALDPQSSLLLWNKAEHYLFSSSLTDQNQVPSELATEGARFNATIFDQASPGGREDPSNEEEGSWPVREDWCSSVEAASSCM
ncbi:hypothetical protein ACP70R_018737 [Stipagrostis hirtigluma subsp. patula]